MSLRMTAKVSSDKNSLKMGLQSVLNWTSEELHHTFTVRASFKDFNSSFFHRDLQVNPDLQALLVPLVPPWQRWTICLGTRTTTLAPLLHLSSAKMRLCRTVMAPPSFPSTPVSRPRSRPWAARSTAWRVPTAAGSTPRGPVGTWSSATPRRRAVSLQQSANNVLSPERLLVLSNTLDSPFSVWTLCPLWAVLGTEST